MPTPSQRTMRPVRKICVRRVNTFTARSMVAKKAVCAPRSVKLRDTMLALVEIEQRRGHGIKQHENADTEQVWRPQRFL